MKLISNFVAVLILIAIVIGVGVAVGGIVSKMLQTSTPKKGVLVLKGSEVIYDPSAGTVWVIAKGFYEGSENAIISSIVLSTTPDSSTTVVITPITSLPELTPGTNIKVVLRGSYNTQPPPSLYIFVSYCFADGSCLTAVEEVSTSYLA